MVWVNLPLPTSLSISEARAMTRPGEHFPALRPDRRKVFGNELAALGLLPTALSQGIGAETQRPFAVVIITRLVSATVLTPFVLPVMNA